MALNLPSGHSTSIDLDLVNAIIKWFLG
ncbi:hypothetical protein LCGC14_3068520, partial [marine sediment metagenome]